jgi:hypothetical protein
MSTQAFLLVGMLFLLPIILMYTGWSYWVFRGKVRADITTYRAGAPPAPRRHVRFSQTSGVVPFRGDALAVDRSTRPR